MAVVATVLTGLLVFWLVQPSCGSRGVATFEFINRSDRVVSNLDLDFICIIPGANGRADQYTRQFSRHFTNVPSGSSAVVQSKTPALILLSSEAWHRPTATHIGTNLIEGQYWSSYRDTVVATPEERATLCFTSPGELIRAPSR